jgi:hypothetical protein
MWRSTPTFPFLMVYRTPLTPLFIGTLSELGGHTALLLAVNTCYALAVAATYCIGACWSRAIGLGSALITLGYIGFGALYREVSSDILFGTVFLVWCAWITWSYRSTAASTYVIHAMFVVALTLIRPVSQAFVIFAVFPWIATSISHRDRLRLSAIFAGTAAVFLVAFCMYNAVRYEDFTIARGGNAINPFYRAFITDRIVREENGPASRALARAVRADLLNHDPYRAYQVTDTMLFEDGDPRAWSDLLALSDRTWGWSSDYSILRRAAIEAIVAHPSPFLQGIAHDTMATFGIIGYPPPSAPSIPSAPVASKPAPEGLPVPTEGQRVPTSYVHWLASSPGGQIPSESSGGRPPRFDNITNTAMSNGGHPAVGDLLEKAQKMFPPPIVWLVAGFVGTIRFEARQRAIFYTLIALAIIGPMAGVIGQGLVYHYRLPVDPLFIAFGVAGFWRTGLSSPGSPKAAA